ncbi:hypothetical protein Hanom_Chr14g01304481 [Helianthus anomalus]
MCHVIRTWEMMWHHLRQSRNWFWLQNSGHKNSCIWVNVGSISFNFDPTSICTLSVFLFQNPREPPSPFSISISCRSPSFPVPFSQQKKTLIAMGELGRIFVYNTLDGGAGMQYFLIEL